MHVNYPMMLHCHSQRSEIGVSGWHRAAKTRQRHPAPDDIRSGGTGHRLRQRHSEPQQENTGFAGQVGTRFEDSTALQVSEEKMQVRPKFLFKAAFRWTISTSYNFQ